MPTSSAAADWPGSLPGSFPAPYSYESPLWGSVGASCSSGIRKNIFWNCVVQPTLQLSLGGSSSSPMLFPSNPHLMHVPSFDEKNNIIVLTLIFLMLDNLRSTFRYNNSLNKATFKAEILSLFFRNARAQGETVISSKRLNIKGEIKLAKDSLGPRLSPYPCVPLAYCVYPKCFLRQCSDAQQSWPK